MGRTAFMNASENVSKALVEEVVRSFGRVRLRVLGSSMAPSVLPGDLISIQRAELHEISLGEIVLFSRNGRLFVHRVVSRDAASEMPCLITRGDRLGHNDPPVTAAEFLGRVTAIERSHRLFEPDDRVRGCNLLILSVLRASDLATRAYLHFLARARNLLPAQTECRP
jgi:signal peptidase I